MVIGITKITLHNYRRFFSFFRFNGQIIKELKKSPCKDYKITGSWNLKTWYTMQQAHLFSSKISSKRTIGSQLIPWKEGKKLFENPQ